MKILKKLSEPAWKVPINEDPPPTMLSAEAETAPTTVMPVAIVIAIRPRLKRDINFSYSRGLSS